METLCAADRPRAVSLRQWIGVFALVIGLASPIAAARAATANHTDVEAGIQAFDAGADSTAWDYFSKAAREGDTLAYYWLGHMTELGLAGHHDLRQAADDNAKAAAAGWGLAKARLGHLYIEGDGVVQDFAAARSWLERAADDNVADAQYDLGRLFENGWGVDKDPITAYTWYNFAARGGNPLYRKARDRLFKMLNPDQVVESEHLIESLRPTVFGVKAPVRSQ